MNDKELQQAGEWIDGKARYKLFDVDRLEILLALTGNEFNWVSA